MRKTNSLLCLTVLAVSVSWSFGGQDVTKSSYFARAVFGAGSSSTIGTCNTTTTAVTERVIFRDAATGQILEDEQGQLAGLGCNTTVFQAGQNLQVGFVEVMITGPATTQAIGSLIIELNVGGVETEPVRVNPEDAMTGFTANFLENAESRNGVAIADTTGNGFNCTVAYRSAAGTLIQGQPIEAGSNEGQGLFFDEVINGLPDGLGWVAVDCNQEVAAITLGQNPVSGNLAVGRVFPPQENGGSGVTDITNAIFTQRSANCDAYVGDYMATGRDLQRGVDVDAEVSITATDSTCTVMTNGIPNHDFNDNSANFATNIAQVERTLTMVQNPSTAPLPTPLSQTFWDAIMLNGVLVDLLSAGCYRPNDQMADSDGNVLAGCMDGVPWALDPLGPGNKFGADMHNAHLQPDGTYHYHGGPEAMFDDNPGANGSPVIGFAADGFPIYGSYFLDGSGTVRKAVSGYTLKSGTRPSGPMNPGGTYNGTYIQDYEFGNTGDLDECNGMTVNGQYGYYVTDTYPWILNCHSGTRHSSFAE